jgi:hypothetical protein
VRVHLEVWAAHEPIATDLARAGADLSTYLAVASDLPDSRWLPGLMQDEGGLFPGVFVTLLALVALTPIARATSAGRWRWAYAAMALVALAISLGPSPAAWGRPMPVPGVYAWLLSVVPLFDVMRVPARFGLLVLLAVSVLAAIGAAALGARLTAGRRWIAAVVVCAMTVIEGTAGTVAVAPGVLSRSEGEAYAYRWLADQPAAAVLELPLSGLGVTNRVLAYQYAVLEHRHPIVNGASRLQSPLQELLAGSASPLVDRALADEVVPFLAGVAVRYVIMRPQQFRDPSLAAHLTLAFERSERVRLVIGLPDVLVYEIEPAPGDVARDVPETAALVPRDAIQLAATDAADRLDLALDGDPATRWLTGREQAGDERVVLTFDRPRDVARLDLVVNLRSLHDYPRDLEVLSADLSGRVRSLYRGAVVAALGRGLLRAPQLPVIAIDLPSNESARLTLAQGGRSAGWYWSIDELRVWERPAGSNAAPATGSVGLSAAPSRLRHGVALSATP